MTIRHGARVGAAAFALGLALAGPQAAGSALADGGASEGPAVSSDSGDARGGAAKAGRSTGQARPARVAQPEVTRSARNGTVAPPVRASATDRTDGPGAGGSPVDVGDGSAAQAPETRVTSRSQRPSTPGSASRAGAGRGSQGRAPAVPVTDAADPVVTGGAPIAAQVPIIRPGIPPFGEATLTATTDAVQDVQATFFNTLANFLIDLPANDVTRFLEGALLMVRQRFFNQAPRVTQSTPYTSADGSIKGRIGAIDLEGDALSYSVVVQPKFGNVALSADGLYAYTPGPDYVGSDFFSVEVSTAPAQNMLTPFADNDSRVVTVEVGAPRPTAPFGGTAGQMQHTNDDVAVYLPDASGRITLQKLGMVDRYTATVTLTELAPDTRLVWMDSSGDRGEVSVEEAIELWPKFESKAIRSGGGVDVGVLYTADDGTASALLLSGVSASMNASGQYVFTGQLSPNPEDRPDSVDRWDVIGREFKTQYENFRRTYGIGNSQTGPFTVSIDFRNAALMADTASPTSYEQYGLYAFDNIQPDGIDAAPMSGATSAAEAPATATSPESAKSGVTASIPLEQSFVIGREDGSVELWTGGRKQLLQEPTVNGAKVVTILAYDRPLQDADGNVVPGSFTGSIDGDLLTVTALGAGSTVVTGQEITGSGVEPGTTITEFLVPDIAGCVEKNSKGDCLKSTGGQGGTDGGLGIYRVSTSQNLRESTLIQPGTVATAPGFIVALSDGTVRLWSATGGWVELQNSFWGTTTPRTIKAMTTFGDGIAVGLSDGSLRVWSGPSGQSASAWKNNWTTLRDCTGLTGCGPVEAMARVKDGIVVANGPAVPENSVPRLLLFTDPFNGIPVFLQDAPAGAKVTAMTAFADGVAVGYDSGALLYWDLRASSAFDPFRRAVVLDNGSGSPVNVLTPYVRFPGSTDLRLIAAYGGLGSVRMFNGYSSPYPSSTPLHDQGWQSPVTFMTTFRSAAIDDRAGIVVGLGNGSVQLWNGQFSNINVSGQNYWTELHDQGWGSGVATLVPFRQNLPDKEGDVVPRDGVVVGLKNGSVQQWSGLITGKTPTGTPTGQGDWTQIVCGPQGCVGPPVKPDPSPSLDKEGTLEKAVQFAKDAQKAGADWGKDNNIGGPGDPLFYGSNLLPPCKASNSCDGQFLPIAVVVEKSPLEKEFKGLDASVKLSYDVNAIAYGYAFMPSGFWNKLRPGKWSLAALAAVETGPSLTVGLGKDGTINAPRSNLLKWDFSTPGPLGLDRVALGLGVDGELTAQLKCGTANCPDKLEAHAYLVPGALFTYNTQAKPGGVGVGFGWYPDLAYEDFTKVTGASVTAILTPYATLSYGIFTPDSWWLIGGWSLFKLGVGYENPLSATVAAGTVSGASLALGTAGFITTHAGILEALTSKLSWDNRFQVFEVNKTYSLF